jgi:hypothetical protein
MNMLMVSQRAEEVHLADKRGGFSERGDWIKKSFVTRVLYYIMPYLSNISESN